MFYVKLCVCVCILGFFFFKQKTAYEMRISDWSSDVCSSDLQDGRADAAAADQRLEGRQVTILLLLHVADGLGARVPGEHRELALVDPLGAELAGMVDPHDAVDQGLVVEVSRQPPRALGPAAAIGFAGHARPSLAPSSPSAPHPNPTAART